MRGTPRRRPGVPEPRRFIPAYAGNTRSARGSVTCPAVHPRVCGEHDQLYDYVREFHGSSPRMRGTPVGAVPAPLGNRFIPAYAGNTSPRARPCGPTTVHPRVCGEHVEMGMQALTATGSSPRMRGTRGRPVRGRVPQRFIPAYAGNTPAASRSTATGSVHPRVCGEHVLARDWCHLHYGSSPRMRGTRPARRALVPRPRFIPAYAGNTRLAALGWFLAAVHPRVCGEHLPEPLPPRPVSWFIPAYAGNTRRWPAR